MLSTYSGNLYAEVIVGRQSAPTEFYLALLTAVPGPDDTGLDIEIVEPSGASYARVLVQSGSGHWAAAADGVCTLTDGIAYTPDENWGTIVAYALCTAASGGYMLFYDTLQAPMVISAGSTVSIPVNSLGLGVVV